MAHYTVLRIVSQVPVDAKILRESTVAGVTELIFSSVVHYQSPGYRYNVRYSEVPDDVLTRFIDIFKEYEIITAYLSCDPSLYTDRVSSACVCGNHAVERVDEVSIRVRTDRACESPFPQEDIDCSSAPDFQGRQPCQ